MQDASATGIPDGRTRKGVETTERILDAAEHLFAKKGYAGTTLRDIASQAGIRNPSIYNHFDGKESLYLAVLERGLRPMIELFAQMATGTVRDGEVDLQSIDGLMNVLAAHPNLPRLMQHEALTGGERLHRQLTEWIRPMFEQAGQLVAFGPGAGLWTPAQTSLLVLAMYNVIAGYFTMAPLYKLIRGEDLLSEKLRARQCELLHQILRLLFPEENAK